MFAVLGNWQYLLRTDRETDLFWRRMRARMTSVVSRRMPNHNMAVQVHGSANITKDTDCPARDCAEHIKRSRLLAEQ